MTILSIFRLPIVRHITAGIIILCIGFYFGNSFFQKKLHSAKQATEAARLQTSEIIGKYTQLEKSHLEQRTILDTLQANMIRLANREHIKVDNHITDTKVKRGGHIDFSPVTKASIQPTDSIPKKKGFIQRIFTKKQ